MGKINLGQALSILANVGVIAGIVILAFEIRDSNNQARVTNQIAISSVNSDWYSSMGADAESSEVFNRGLSDFSGLTDGEKARFGFLIRSYLERLTIGDFVARSGLGFTGSEFGARQIGFLFEQQGFRQWWSETDRRTLPLPTRELLQQAEESVR